ncbi:hypothetical protein VNO80_15514 [Phaseolus coccineus]|uniref:Uncharacterized protein n=1 Tax=Phaseolus coccineus TaxID=3886 RepID=A0AAN9MLS0_PHACN
MSLTRAEMARCIRSKDKMVAITIDSEKTNMRPLKRKGVLSPPKPNQLDLASGDSNHIEAQAHLLEAQLVATLEGKDAALVNLSKQHEEHQATEGLLPKKYKYLMLPLTLPRRTFRRASSMGLTSPWSNF